MEIIEFNWCNAVAGKDQPQYRPLPLMKVGSKVGGRISCWRLSWRERFRVMFSGKVYLSLMTFNQPIQPQLMSTKLEELTDAIREAEA